MEGVRSCGSTPLGAKAAALAGGQESRHSRSGRSRCDYRSPQTAGRRGQLVTFTDGKWAGRVWRILGIEENGRIRFFEPDKVRRIDKPENYQKAQITTLLKDGLRILWAPLCGIASGSVEG